MFKRTYLLMLGALFLAATAAWAADPKRNLAVSKTAAPATEQRVALVIGNSSYKDAPLRNPVNDAEDMAAVLRNLGFRVTLRKNDSYRQMVSAITEFGNELKKGGVGLFYYAGHGVQSKGRNYLLPVGAKIDTEAELEFESVDANRVLAFMEDAGNRMNIVVLDACRNNVYARSFRSASRGLAPMDAARGSFIAYATAPGSVAADGEGRNGLYTQHLLASLKQPDTDIDKVFRRVTAGVSRATGGKQVPWVSTSLTADFSFRPGAAASLAASAPADPLAVELAYWESIKDSAAKPATAEPGVSYVLQAASFATFPEADQLKTKLALSGLPTQIQKVSIEGQGDRYRVRLGPFEKIEELDAAEQQLAKLGLKLGLKPLRLKVKKEGA